MYISSRVYLQESRYKAAVCISHHVLILRKVYIKLLNVYIITCLSSGKLIKLAAGLYYHVFICMNVNIKLRSVYIVRCSSTGKLI